MPAPPTPSAIIELFHHFRHWKIEPKHVKRLRSVLKQLPALKRRDARYQINLLSCDRVTNVQIEALCELLEIFISKDNLL